MALLISTRLYERWKWKHFSSTLCVSIVKASRWWLLGIRTRPQTLNASDCSWLLKTVWHFASLFNSFLSLDCFQSISQTEHWMFIFCAGTLSSDIFPALIGSIFTYGMVHSQEQVTNCEASLFQFENGFFLRSCNSNNTAAATAGWR